MMGKNTATSTLTFQDPFIVTRQFIFLKHYVVIQKVFGDLGKCQLKLNDT